MIFKKAFSSRSAADTEAIGQRLASALEKKNIKRATVAMRGEMGVGKTAFVRGFASHFGISSVKSPTYTIVNEYRGRASVYHFDMYRISSEDDLFSTGYEDYIAKDGYTVAEWSENVEEFLPEDAFFVTIERSDEGNGRQITIEGSLEVEI